MDIYSRSFSYFLFVLTYITRFFIIYSLIILIFSNSDLTDWDRWLYSFYFYLIYCFMLCNTRRLFFIASFYIFLCPLSYTFFNPFSTASNISSIQYATYYPIYLYFNGTPLNPNLIPNENSTITGWNSGLIITGFTFSSWRPEIYVESTCLLFGSK